MAVLRLRGRVTIRGEIEDTLKLLRLHKKNHAILMSNEPSKLGMIKKIKDYATWGEVTLESVERLLKKRGRTKGNMRLNDNYVKEKLGYKSISELAKAIYNLETNLQNLGLKPVFRLHPPKGGFRGPVKKAYPTGQVGYRGEDINELIEKMG